MYILAPASPAPVVRPPLLNSPLERRSPTLQEPQSRPLSPPLPESRSPGLLPLKSRLIDSTPPQSRPIVFPPLQSRPPVPPPPETRPTISPPSESRPIISPPPQSRPIVFSPLQSHSPVPPPPETRPTLSPPSESRPIMSPSPESILNASLPPGQSRTVVSQTPPFIGPMFSHDFQLPPPIDAASVMRVHPFSSFNPGPQHTESQSVEHTDHPMAESSDTIHEAIKDLEERMQAIQDFGNNSNHLDGGEIKDLEMSCIDYSPEKHEDSMH